MFYGRHVGAPRKGTNIAITRVSLRNAPQKRAFHFLFKISRIKTVLEAPRTGGPGEWDSAETLVPEGSRGSRKQRTFCFNCFSFVFFR